MWRLTFVVQMPVDTAEKECGSSQKVGLKPVKWKSISLLPWKKRLKELLTPKVTSPGPLAFGLNPSTLSFSVGSDLDVHK